MLDINAMLLFARVVDAESYTQAAKELGIPKSTLSRKISQLEEQLKVRLLQRNSRNLNLTEEGRQVYANCQNILREVEAVQSSVESAQQDVSGTLKVLFPISFEQSIAARLCAGFLKRYPKVDINFQFCDGEMDVVGLNFDIAVMFGPLANSNLIARPLFEREMVLVASPDYLQSHGTPTDASALAQHQGILLGGANTMPIWPLGIGTQKTLVSFSSKVCVNSALAVKQMALAGLGIAMLTETQCRQALEAGQLVSLLTDYSLESLKAYGLYSSRNQLAPRIACFLDYVQQSFDLVEKQQLQLSPVRGLPSA